MNTATTYFFKNFLILFALMSISSVAQSNQKDKDGFVKIFNGEDFEGWHLKLRNNDDEMAKNIYAIEDGMIHVFKNAKDSLELNTGKNDTHGLFYTNKKYSKYILKFEYKWGKKIANNFERWQYDAGCYYHVYDDAIWPKGIEYQIRYNHVTNRNHTGDFWGAGVTLDWYSQDGKTFLAPKDGGLKMEQKKNELLGYLNTKYNALNNQWNSCEIIVMGNEYTIHKLNGIVVNMATNLSVGEGIIGFQSETAEIYYRDIKIKEFDKIIPMKKFLK
ncbi:3-keto-disaccharide hydrolase [Flavobacterium algicola]|uniref:3-keto-disaccharide hydrolase n=1 Tax=Flavobacterium algicola TaxID=556529 RepID=UPI001EFEBD86|nr:DUF1080 domain-containing protein [Flavobacterium algicola]MCG9792844.1 DUF1080 domain-containing protein [Flavobacterium algicola]